MALQPRVSEVERLLFRSDVVVIGTFRCPAGHPLFVESEPTSGHLMVFPRTSAIIDSPRAGRVTAGPASVLFYNRGEAYRRRKIDAVHEADWFMIAPEVVRDVVSGGGEGFPFFIGPASARTYLAQRRLSNALHRGELDALAVEECVMRLLGESVEEAARKQTRAMKISADIEAVKARIGARPAANPTLRSLASLAGCSPFHLSRLFPRATGYTLTEYRHAVRVRSALAALRDPRTDLTQLALDLGYSSHSHFTMVFRRHFGITPSEFRNSPSPPLPFRRDTQLPAAMR